MSPKLLSALGVAVAIGGVAAYVLLFHVAVVRNHPESYVIAFAAGTALAAAGALRWRRWPAWLALGVTTLLLAGGAWFNFVVARVPDTPPMLRVGEPAPDFTLPDATGRLVSLFDYRGKQPVIAVFYRGFW